MRERSTRPVSLGSFPFLPSSYTDLFHLSKELRPGIAPDPPAGLSSFLLSTSIPPISLPVPSLYSSTPPTFLSTAESIPTHPPPRSRVDDFRREVTLRPLLSFSLFFLLLRRMMVQAEL